MSFYNDSTAKFTNQNLNSVGSGYAQNYGHDISKFIEKVTNKALFDARPKQFTDLVLLNRIPALDERSDEFFFQEAGYQREPLTATAVVAIVNYPATQTIPVASTDVASENIIVVYQDGTKGTVVGVDKTNSTVTVSPMVGGSLPAVAVGDLLGNLSTVDHDGSEGFASSFRLQTIERSNYIQLFNMSIRYGEVELLKMQKAGVTSNHLSMEREEMFNQHRIGLSNALWIGQKGEVITRGNQRAKTTGGVVTAMQEAGAPKITATSATLVDAFEDAVFSSEYGSYGDVRFAYMTPRKHRELSKAYKEELTRYAPGDTIAMLNLKEVNIGSSRIVLVPFKRFEDQASFPVNFEDKIFILDHKNIRRRQLYGERSGETDGLLQGIPKRYRDIWVDSSMGIEFNNPLGCAEIDVL